MNDQERRNIIADIQYMATLLKIDAAKIDDPKLLARVHKRMAALLRDVQTERPESGR